MSDNENEQETEENPFFVEIAKQGRAACKKCKEKCPAGELRIAKLVYNPFASDKMKQWHHLPCLFESFINQRPTTKRLENIEEVDGVENLSEENQNELRQLIEESEAKLKQKWGEKYKRAEVKPKKVSPKKEEAIASTSNVKKGENKCLFREFRKLIVEVTNESSYLEKTAIIKTFLTKGSDGSGFKGDIIQWCRLLLPGVVKRIYNLQSKQLIKLFSKIFGTDQDDMLEDLEKGDIGETIQDFFDKSAKVVPCKKSLITVQEVDDFLEELSTLTKEDEQMCQFKTVIKKCTANDLKIIIRLIKHDLRMNAGAKHVLDAIHPDAYQAFQSSRDLKSVLERILSSSTIGSVTKSVKATIKVMTPVLPMLAEACKSVEQALKKCPNGMYSEIKYDGERVQLHKHGSDFKYFSRSLKPVLPHKVNHFKDYIPKAFPHARDLILDSEVLVIDTVTGKPLPFGSLGKHKKDEYENANVCLFVFDCIYFNGEVLTHKTMKERRKILLENMTEIQNHIMFSEVQEIHTGDELAKMITSVLRLGLEGLVLKDLGGIYEPGKRHWLKVKKDYLCDGAMADSADLIVLGSWFGTGKKGGMMSIFLMGCYDEYTKRFLTVTKVHTGHDDKTLEKLQDELDMIKISSDFSKVPPWLKCTRTMVPDFVARDPKKQPVWEITGAEFTQHEVHTADGISIRFPRVTKIRDDKTWEQATTLQELKTLFKNSKENVDFHLLFPKHESQEIDVKVEKMETDESFETEKGIEKDKEVEKGRAIKKEMDDSCSGDLKESKKNRDIKERKFKKESDGTDESFKVEKGLKKAKESKKERASKKEMDDSCSGDFKIESKKNRNIKKEADSSSSEEDWKINSKRSKNIKKENFSPKALKEMKQIKNEDNSSPKRRKKETPIEEEEIFIKDWYPQIFRGVRIYFMDQNDETDDIIRHFLARGGDVLKNDSRHKATHVIYVENNISEVSKDFSQKCKHVIIGWIRDSVANNKILDVRPYSVTWIP